MSSERWSRVFALVFLCAQTLFSISVLYAEAPHFSVQLPPGFDISVFSDQVPGARSLAVGAHGTIFVGTRDNPGKVYAIQDMDHDFHGEKVFIIADDLNTPNGVAFRKGSLYVAEINRILRYDNIEERLETPPKPVVVRDDYADETRHGWKYIAFGPDDWLYVPVGAPCNICKSEDARFASITRISADGKRFEMVATGVRNSVGFDWHPETKELWFTDNGRDWLGDDSPPDELNHVQKLGEHFGYPYCHAGTIPDPKFGNERKCDEFVPPSQNLGPHVAALGVHFYRGKMFPQHYHHQLFIAEHGSWNRSSPSGYQVSLVLLKDGKSVLYQSFATGFRNREEVYGRPVAFAELDDGSLLLSDDHGGAVYRISYTSSVPTQSAVSIPESQKLP